MTQSFSLVKICFLLPPSAQWSPLKQRPLNLVPKSYLYQSFLCIYIKYLIHLQFRYTKQTKKTFFQILVIIQNFATQQKSGRSLKIGLKKWLFFQKSFDKSYFEIQPNTEKDEIVFLVGRLQKSKCLSILNVPILCYILHILCILIKTNSWCQRS